MKKDTPDPTHEKGIDYIADIHLHNTLKSYNTGYPEPSHTPWESVVHGCKDKSLMRLLKDRSDMISKVSQADLTECAKGNLRLIINSLTPVEQGFLTFRRLPSWLIGKVTSVDILEHITGFSPEKIKALKKGKISYYDELKGEYDYLEKYSGKNHKGHSYHLVDSWKEAVSVLKHPKKLAMYLSIEGGHVLTEVNPSTKETKFEAMAEKISQRVCEIKRWAHPPVFMTLSHHFWNGLSGHSRSFKGPVAAMVNQSKHINAGFTNVGKYALTELLKENNGKRILIDIKHLSARSRSAYYEQIQFHNALHPERKIPILCSHAGVNSFNTLVESIKERDSNAKTARHYHRNWSINLCKEDIKAIYKSDGLIGLILDKGVLGGDKALQKINIAKSEAHRKEMLAHLFWTTALEIVKTVEEKAAWDMISLGSDYDGAITHFDGYDTTASFPDLMKDLEVYLSKTELKRELWYGYEPYELVNKIFRLNASVWLEKHT